MDLGEDFSKMLGLKPDPIPKKSVDRTTEAKAMLIHEVYREVAGAFRLTCNAPCDVSNGGD